MLLLQYYVFYSNIWKYIACWTRQQQTLGNINDIRQGGETKGHLEVSGVGPTQWNQPKSSTQTDQFADEKKKTVEFQPEVANTGLTGWFHLGTGYVLPLLNLKNDNSKKKKKEQDSKM